MKQLNSLGDTIIEVLLAIAVVGFVLSGAYVSANQSLNNSREAQERGEALKLVESQLEVLKQLASAGNNTIYSAATSFCLNTSNLSIISPANSHYATVPALNNDDFTAYRDVCQGQGNGGLYNLAIQRDASNTNQFTAYARWDRVGGNGRDEVQIISRVYP